MDIPPYCDVDMPPYCDVDIPPYCDVDIPPYCEVDRPPPCAVLKLRGHILMFGIVGLVKEYSFRSTLRPNVPVQARAASCASPATGGYADPSMRYCDGLLTCAMCSRIANKLSAIT